MLPVLICGLLLQATTSAANIAVADSVATIAVPVVAGQSVAPDTQAQRPHAVELSDWYYHRLFLHRWGSYIELPLFAAEYDLGNRLFSAPGDRGLRDEHLAVAAGLGVLFTSNTITGGWNLLEAWPPPGSHRTLLLTHTALMLGSDAGFAIAGALGGQAKHQVNMRSAHRAVAVGSMGLATIGTGMMWLWDR